MFYTLIKHGFLTNQSTRRDLFYILIASNITSIYVVKIATAIQ